MPDLTLTLTGMDKIVGALERFPRNIVQYMVMAGHESGTTILETQGLRKYPPATGANAPPYPFYIRGRGTETSKGHNTGKSEKYGSQFYVQPSSYGVVIGNRASYAKYLTDPDYQSARMAKIGWRKLIDVAYEKLADITRIYQAWIDKLIRDLDL